MFSGSITSSDLWNINTTCGSADLFFISATDIKVVIEELKQKNIEIVEGVVDRTSALGKIRSVYFRDPNMNLIEASNYSK
ncbi:VOC family protein [Chryseobacterium soli]|uniref:hypothetical protein n=1 Tax=Chryseobacterium soli TaxID=445961 RepID=UPI00068D5439|nr:hypothetical protein [Chryseobacterium soli]